MLADPWSGWCAGAGVHWSRGPWEGGMYIAGVVGSLCITVTYSILTVGFCCKIGKERLPY